MRAATWASRASLAGAQLRQRLTVPVLLALASLLLLYGPTVWGLANGLWQFDSHSHGPIVLAVSIWLFMRGLLAHEQAGLPDRPLRWSGAVVLALGLVLYALGRSQSVSSMEVGSAVPVLLGAVLMVRGPALARRLWFAFVFLLFLVPLPGSIVDAITQPMKLGVSWAVESLMYAMGYPIGRAGVVLGIGPYQLFVADACAGLNSLFMLEAFGLLYLNVVSHASAVRNAILAVLIVPISFISNVVRVVVLALVTYHFGDEAGQGFIHGFSGMVLFVVALILTIAADTIVRAIVSRVRPPVVAPSGKAARDERPAPTRVARPLAITPRHGASGWGLLVCASIATLATWLITPPPLATAVAPDLEAAIPERFGDWKRVDLPGVTVGVVPTSGPGGAKVTDRPYDGVVMRAYANSRGETVALAVAYAADQRQEVKIHRPELCYPAQGFRVLDQHSVALIQSPGLNGISSAQTGIAQTGAIPGTRLHVKGGSSEQTVSYLIRIGTAYPQSGWALRNALFLNSLFRRTNDGLLLRASSALRTAETTSASYALNEAFLADLVSALPDASRRLLFGVAARSPLTGVSGGAF